MRWGAKEEEEEAGRRRRRRRRRRCCVACAAIMAYSRSYSGARFAYSALSTSMNPPYSPSPSSYDYCTNSQMYYQRIYLLYILSKFYYFPSKKVQIMTRYNIKNCSEYINSRIIIIIISRRFYHTHFHDHLSWLFYVTRLWELSPIYFHPYN